jgi:anti-sigma factor RsiW
MTSQTNSNSTLCEEVLNLIPAYAFGTTDPEETRFVEKHLSDCPEAVAELSLYGEIRDGMLFEPPLVTAPPHLAEKIAQIPRSPKVAVQPLRPESITRPHFNVGWAAAAAVLVLFVFSNLYWFNQIQGIQAENAALLEDQRMFTAMRSGDLVETELAATDETMTDYSGSVLWKEDMQSALLRVANLPSTDEDQEYQLWLIGADHLIGVGTFRVNPDGTGVLKFESDEPFTAFSAFGITLEPAGGSPAPTTSPMLIGEISST